MNENILADDFACCGGNNEPKPEHTRDCESFAKLRALRDVIDACPQIVLALQARSELDALRALLRRDWAVRVLDAWTASTAYSLGYRCSQEAGNWLVSRGGGGAQHAREPNPDAARHAAALAVFPSLSDAVRAELGECP